MRRVTTLVALVGPDAAEVAAAAGGAANVSHEPVEGGPEETWRRAARHSSVYTIVPADPLADVVAAWAARLRGEEPELELAIAGAADLPAPDYYLVDPGLPAPDVDWYLGLLEPLSPRRVLPVDLAGDRVLAALASLRYGPELPPLRELAARTRDYVPAPSPLGRPAAALVL